MKFDIITLGCKVNSCESAAIAEAMEQAGYERCAENEISDIYIVNSCAVTSIAVKKAKQMISRCKRSNPSAVSVLCGCYPQSYPEAAGKTTGADIVVGNGEKSAIPAMVEEYLEKRIRMMRVSPLSREFDEKCAGADIDRTRAFIKIEDGCDRFCTYCIIPFARGRVRSRSPEEISKQAKLCADSGHKEIVLTGINLGCYGQDIGLTLADAVKAADVNGIERIRLGSLEPDMMTRDEIEKLAQTKKLCPHFHLSLQSGSDNTLKRMCRCYDTAQYRQAVEALREIFPNCAITTDIMVGFPGETDEEFEQSMDFAEEMRFAKMHVFSYSIREGTVAAASADQIHPQIKTLRARAMEELSVQLEREFFGSQIGTVHTVLIEKKRSDAYSYGLTESYIPVRIYGKEIPRHTLVTVRIKEADDGFCIGEVIV